MLTLKNHLLQVQINPIGAELSALNSVKNNTAFLWHADPNIWGSHAPNLFPIIGALKNNTYIYNGNLYSMTKHGFVRHNEDVLVKNQTDTSVKFSLSSNEKLLKMYPFHFEFEIWYNLKDNVLTIDQLVKNKDAKTMHFSLGGHPAFTCPLGDDEAYIDYYLEFEKSENSESFLLNMDNGLMTNKTKPVITEGNKIKLHGDLFNNDALVFKNLQSRKVTLKHKNKGTVLSVIYNDFPYLGIWAKPNAPYVCIEPWLGIADVETTNQKLEDKEGILSLAPNSVFNASYSIEIDQRHLV